MVNFSPSARLMSFSVSFLCIYIINLLRLIADYKSVFCIVKLFCNVHINISKMQNNILLIYSFCQDGSVLRTRSGGPECFAPPDFDVLPVLGSDVLQRSS